MEMVESVMVVPSKETPKHSIWLSNLDLLSPREHTPTFFFYRRPSGDTNFLEVETLKAALSEALVHFYPFAGRLDIGEDGRVEVRCTGEGAFFTVVRSELDVDDFEGFVPSEKLKKALFPTVESSQPPCMLLLVQVTFFKGGDATISTAMHHTAVDGCSAFHFMKLWSDLARIGIIELSISPFFDRTLLRARSPPSVPIELVEYKPNIINSSSDTPPFTSSILKLSGRQIAALKNNGTNKKPHSTFKAVVAHMWRSACVGRGLQFDQETRLYTVVDARARLIPPLPPEYFGNAILRTSESAKVGDIVSGLLEFGGEMIGRAVAKIDDAHVLSLIDYVEQGSDVKGWRLLGTDLFVISWLGLPVYDVDFGWGKPEFMGRADMFGPGFGYVLNSPGSDGGATVIMAMEVENMQGFIKAFYDGLD